MYVYIGGRIITYRKKIVIKQRIITTANTLKAVYDEKKSAKSYAIPNH
jgi:hypothetical protein